MKNKIIEKIFEEKLPDWNELKQIREYIEFLEDLTEKEAENNQRGGIKC